MYAIVLAGGYATRLWPLTKGTPKALLPIAGKPILDYITEKLQYLNPPPTRIIISTNTIFQPQFKSWLASRNYKNIEFFPDISSSDKNKPGAIKAMACILDKFPEDDVLIIAGDSMFYDNLSGMLETFKKKNESVVAVYNVDNPEDAKRCATVTLAWNGRVSDFNEKPLNPRTTMVSGAVYLLRKGIKNQIDEYLLSKLSTDQPGRFIEWLYRQKPVYSYKLKDPLWDIGTPQAYHACNDYFTSLTINRKGPS